jgi:hypothetical protein
MAQRSVRGSNMSALWIGCSAFLVFVGLLLLVARPLRDWMWRRELHVAQQSFRLQREVLEAKFFDLASASGKPRDLRWIECDWLDAVTYARDRQTGLLTAFVAVNIRFEAVEGGEMEGIDAVGNIRDAAAVFHYQAGQWGTGGRALFNMNPADALLRLQGQFEPVGT